MDDSGSEMGKNLASRLRAVSSTEISTMYELTREAAKEIERLRKVIQDEVKHHKAQCAGYGFGLAAYHRERITVLERALKDEQ